MLSLWELQITIVGTGCVDMPPQHRQKGLLGKEWEETSCFHFLLAQQGVGMAQNVSSRLKNTAACSGHFGGQLEELPVPASALGLICRGGAALYVSRN